MKRNSKQFLICFICVWLLATSVTAVYFEQMANAEAKEDISVQLQIGKVKVTKKTYPMKAGTKKALKVTASKKISSIKYTSSKPKVAAVSSNGTIKAKKTGTAKITAVIKTEQGSKTVWMKVKVSAATPNPSPEIRGKKMKITIGNTTLMATLEDNSSAEALKELLAEEPLTINMRDYANMEKVGSIGTNLPTNDEQISTEPGDIILYQGNSLVIYYDTNTWSLTRIGKIDNVTQTELLEALGDGDVDVTLSLE